MAKNRKKAKSWQKWQKMAKWPKTKVKLDKKNNTHLIYKKPLELIKKHQKISDSIKKQKNYNFIPF